MVESFKPLEGSFAHTLILGTMPGTASLSMQQYYAHQRNAFWPIMMAIIDNNPVSKTMTAHHQGYQSVCHKLTRAGFAIWDVLQYCDRPGSLDSNIVRDSEVPNAINLMVKKHPELHTIAFNGRTAEKLFNRHIAKVVRRVNPTDQRTVIQTCIDGVILNCQALPSTSPAMASLSLEEKCADWRQCLSETVWRADENISTS